MKQSFRVQLLRSFFCASQRYNALCIDSVVPSISTSGATRNHRTLKCSPNPYLAIVYRYRKIARLQLYHSDWWTQRAAKTLQKHQQPFQLNSVNAAGQHCFLHCFDVLLYGVRVYRSIFAIFCVSVCVCVCRFVHVPQISRCNRNAAWCHRWSLTLLLVCLSCIAHRLQWTNATLVHRLLLFGCDGTECMEYSAHK